MAKPSSFRAEISVNGDIHAAERIAEMGARALNTFPLMEAMKELLFAQQKARVLSTPWEPLKDSTVARKLAQNEDPSIFRDEWRPMAGRSTRTGNKLWFALTMNGATGQIKRATRTTATFGVDSAGRGSLYYARWVQNVHGTKRKILAISDADALVITMKTANWIYEGYGAGR
jgi:hypothetical protein